MMRSALVFALFCPITAQDTGSKLGSFLNMKSETFQSVRDSELQKIQSEHVPGERHNLRPADWLNAVNDMHNTDKQFYKQFPGAVDHLVSRDDSVFDEPDMQDPNQYNQWAQQDPIATRMASAGLRRKTNALLHRR